jgi:hypothetical protein
MTSRETLAKVRHLWNEQVRLQQLYLDRHEVSGMDSLDALARRRNSRHGGAHGDKAG